MPVIVFQGNTKTLNVNIAYDDGTPFSGAGYALYYTARQSYANPNYIFNIGTTGVGSNLANASTGLFTINLTSGDTNQCPGLYNAGFTLTGGNPATISSFDTDGLEIVAAPLVL